MQRSTISIRIALVFQTKKASFAPDKQDQAWPRLARRAELSSAFGEDWQRKCFGRATHFLSHSWGMPFAGFVNALSDVPAGSFVWNDMCACTQARWAASHTVVS